MEAASGVSYTRSQDFQLNNNNNNTTQQRIKLIFPQQSKAKWRCVTPSDFSYINKYKPKMLTAIHFTRIESEHTKTSRVRNLRLAMMSNKRLSSLIFGEHVANQLPQLLSSTTHWQKIEFLNQTGRLEARGREDFENLLKLKKCRDLSVLKISYAARTILVKATMLSWLSDELKWLRKLKVLDLNLLDYHHTANTLLLDPNAVILKFKPPKFLVSFRLNFEASTLDSELLREFTSNVQKCLRLQDLKLIFDARVDNISVSEAQIWISFFKKMGHLKAFTFQRPFLSDQEFKGSQMFLEGLEHFKNLETLNLSLHGLMDDNPPILLTKAFYLHLASLPRLKSLSLALHGSNFPQAGNCQGFTKNILLLTHLQELDIRLRNHGLPFIDDSFFKAFAQAILHLKKLEHIKLFFKRQKTTPEVILSLVQSLQQLPRLKTLDINPDLEQKSLEHLSNLMTNISLTSFSLTSHKFIKARPSLISSFMNLWKKQTSINPFFSALENLNSLSSLSLNLYALTISNEELNHLSLALKQLKKLSFLSLKVPQFDPQNDYEGLRSLLTVPGQMKNLKSLNLTINGDYFGANISPKEINLIVLSVEQWKSLESLRIGFMSMHKFGDGDNFMSQLSEGMAKLTKLKSIEVSFFLPVKFENKMIGDLLAKLTPLKDLETLILNYCRPNDGTFDISSICLKEKNSFRRLEKLLLDHYRYSISYQN